MKPFCLFCPEFLKWAGLRSFKFVSYQCPSVSLCMVLITMVLKIIFKMYNNVETR